MIPERYNGMTITSDVERDFRADLTAGKCPDNAGCNACTACMCGLAEDAIAEVERLRALLAGERERALYEAMERDKALRKEAERRVREIRGSDDVPGFEACVEAEMEAMREIKVVDADARDLWCALNCANSRFIEPDAVGPDVHFVRTMLERHRAKYAPHDAIQSNPRPAPDVREE